MKKHQTSIKKGHLKLKQEYCIKNRRILPFLETCKLLFTNQEYTLSKVDNNSNFKLTLFPNFAKNDFTKC